MPARVVALSELKVDELGLEQLDREYLSMITQKFGGGPVGLDTLSTAIGEDRGTFHDLRQSLLKVYPSPLDHRQIFALSLINILCLIALNLIRLP
jgi:hypothetical protein